MLDFVSSRLAFVRDVGCLVVRQGESIVWHATTGESRHVAVPGLRAMAAFGDQIWTLGKSGLERWNMGGRSLGPGVPTAAHDALVPAFAGPAAAACGQRLWLGDGASVREIPLADGAMPFVGLRAVTSERHRGGKVVRLGSVAWVLPAAASLVGAAALFDGSSVVLFVQRPDRVEAWVSTVSGEMLHQIRMPEGRLRVAARRGIALVQTPDGKFVAFDLRYGRELGTGALAGEDVAIDPNGHYIATITGDEVQVTTLAELLAETNARKEQQMSEFTDLFSSTEGLREAAEGVMGATKIPGSGLMGLMNNGLSLADDIEDGNWGDAVHDGLGVIDGGFTFMEDLSGGGEIGAPGEGGMGSYVKAAMGGWEMGEGIAEIATDDDGFGVQSLDGLHDILTGGADVGSAFGGQIGAVSEAFGAGMDVGDAIAPLIFGSEEEDNKAHSEAIPEGGVFHPSTGNGAFDWAFGVGEYTDGRF